jgi:hypothetical protein
MYLKININQQFLKKGISTGNVFITPFLIKVNVNDFLGTFIWVIPTLLDIALRPLVRLVLRPVQISALGYRKSFLIFSCAISSLGLLQLATARHLSQILFSQSD